VKAGLGMQKGEVKKRTATFVAGAGWHHSLGGLVYTLAGDSTRTMKNGLRGGNLLFLKGLDIKEGKKSEKGGFTGKEEGTSRIGVRETKKINTVQGCLGWKCWKHECKLGGRGENLTNSTGAKMDRLKRRIQGRREVHNQDHIVCKNGGLSETSIAILESACGGH